MNRDRPSPKRIVREQSGPAAAESPWVQLRSATYHPFVYQRMIAAADRAARPGDIVHVYDKTGRLFGRGLFNPKSQIAVRMLAWGDDAIDEAFWRERIGRAVALRRKLNLDERTDAYRLIHAEGDGLSGLVVERYADALVFELFSLGMSERREMLAGLIIEALGPPASLDRPDRTAPAWRTIFRADRQIQDLEGFKLPMEAGADTGGADAPTAGGGEASRAGSRDASRATVRDASRTIIREHGIRYRVDMNAGHKTGFFCDQRDNRRRLADLCRETSVLDLCCYTGGFGLNAKVRGGAREVTCVDLDEAALAVARENVNLNQARIDLVHADAFIYMRQMLANQRTFDVVVLDPPKLAPSRAQLEEALRQYHDLNALAAQMTRPGGILLTCSCSGLVSRQDFIETVHRAIRRAGRTGQLFDLTGAGPDHPVMLNCPESAYLKAAWLRVQ